MRIDCITLPLSRTLGFSLLIFFPFIKSLSEQSLCFSRFFNWSFAIFDHYTSLGTVD